MKFSQALQLNIVPDWAAYYVQYPSLKKHIYAIEREQLFREQNQEEIPDITQDSSALLDAPARARNQFLPLIEAELDRIAKFYTEKERDFVRQVQSLKREIADLTLPPIAEPEEVIVAPEIGMMDDVEEDLARTATVRLRTNSGSNADGNIMLRIDLVRRARDLYVQLVELREYVQLNQTALSKILKKFDKMTNNKVRTTFMDQIVKQSYPFRDATRQALQSSIRDVEIIHAKAAGIQNLTLNSRELRRHVRERVEFERNTVWRDVIGLERKHSAIGLREIGDSPEDEEIVTTGLSAVNLNLEDIGKTKSLKKRRMLLGIIPLPKWCRTRILWLVLSIALFLLVLEASNLLPVQSERHCAALVVFVSILWATEVMPLFATSLMVPFFVVLLGVLRNPIDETQLPANLAAKRIFAAMFSPAIMLLLGGFAIAAALSKHMVAKEIAARVLSRAGSGPRRLLLAVMLVATLLSMFISNVAAPVLCFSLIHVCISFILTYLIL